MLDMPICIHHPRTAQGKSLLLIDYVLTWQNMIKGHILTLNAAGMGELLDSRQRGVSAICYHSPCQGVEPRDTPGLLRGL